MEINDSLESNRRGIIPLVMISIILIIVVIPNISAFEWDNVKSYDSINKVVTVKDSLLGIIPTTTVSTIKLETPQVVWVEAGKDKKIAEFTINNYEEEYKEFFKELEFYDTNKQKTFLKEKTKTATYKYLVSRTEKYFDDYTESCKSIDSKECEKVYVGKHKEIIDDWKELNITKPLPKGKITIGIFVDVEPNDYVEWVPTLFGQRIIEWATYGETQYFKTTNFPPSTQVDFGDGSKQGMRINVSDYSVIIDVVSKYTESTANRSYILYDNMSIRAYADYSGTNNASSWTGNNTLNNNTIYYIVEDKTGSDWTRAYKNPTLQAYPISNPGFDILSAWDGESGGGNSTVYWTGPYGVTYRQAGIPDAPTGAVTVNQSYPATLTNFSHNSINFTCNYSTTNTVERIINVTFKVYNASNYLIYNNFTNELNEVSLNKTYYTRMNDSDYTWSCWVSGNTTTANTGNRTLMIDTTPPNITVYYPVEGGSYNYNVTALNWSVTDTHRSVCFWYNEVTGANETANCDGNFTGLNATEGSTYRLVYANDTVGNLRTIKRSYTQLTLYSFFPNFTTTVVEDTEQNINFYILSINPITSFNGTLYYNNSLQTSLATIINSTYVKVNSTIDSPLVNGSTPISFYWNYSINGMNFTSANYNQTVTNLETLSFSGDCSNGTVPSITFYFTDERNSSNLTANLKYDFNYSVGSNSQRIYGNLTGVYNFSLCINTTLSSVYNVTYGQMSYSLTGYGDREYFFINSAISNITQYITLYMLGSDIYQKFFFSAKSGITDLGGYYSQIQKYDVATISYQTVGMRKTDAYGEFVEYMDLDKDYRFLLLDNQGKYYGSTTRTAICQATPCEMTLQYDNSTSKIFSEYYGSYGGRVIYNLSYNKTLNSIILDYVDLTGTATYARLQVNKIKTNSTITLVCNVSNLSVSGTIRCNMTGYSGDFEARAYISRSPEKFVDIRTFLVETFSGTIGMTGLFIVILFMFVIFFAFAHEPAIAVMSIPLGLIATKLMSILPVGWTPIIIFTILAVFIAYKMRA